MEEEINNMNNELQHGLHQCLEDMDNTYKFVILEIFSPPRVTQVAKHRGLRPGWAMDISSVDPWTGRSWDLSLKVNQDRVKHLVRKHKPWVIMGCPPCTMYSWA